MTSRPRLYTGGNTLVGLLSVALFAILVGVFLASDFGDPATFEGATEITSSIGYAMFNLDAGNVPSEGFLVAFIVIALALDAALDAAILLAKRDEGGER